MEEDNIIDLFKKSLADDHPDRSWSDFLKALWLDGKGDWAGAHDRVQDDSSRYGAWIHAYLHRKEGDLWNADYWYRRAGRKRPEEGLEEEWEELVRFFLEDEKNPEGKPPFE